MSTTNNRNYGEYLGYPSCCIEFFGDVAVPYYERPSISIKMARNGYIPCPECAQKLQDNKISYEALINPNRKCSVPFSTTLTGQQMAQITQELQLIRQ